MLNIALTNHTALRYNYQRVRPARVLRLETLSTDQFSAAITGQSVVSGAYHGEGSVAAERDFKHGIEPWFRELLEARMNSDYLDAVRSDAAQSSDKTREFRNICAEAASWYARKILITEPSNREADIEAVAAVVVSRFEKRVRNNQFRFTGADDAQWKSFLKYIKLVTGGVCTERMYPPEPEPPAGPPPVDDETRAMLKRCIQDLPEEQCNTIQTILNELGKAEDADSVLTSKKAVSEAKKRTAVILGKNDNEIQISFSRAKAQLKKDLGKHGLDLSAIFGTAHPMASASQDKKWPVVCDRTEILVQAIDNMKPPQDGKLVRRIILLASLETAMKAPVRGGRRMKHVPNNEAKTLAAEISDDVAQKVAVEFNMSVDALREKYKQLRAIIQKDIAERSKGGFVGTAAPNAHDQDPEDYSAAREDNPVDARQEDCDVED